CRPGRPMARCRVNRVLVRRYHGGALHELRGRRVMARIWWFLPLCESLHFIGMAMLVGVVGVIDLRMLGMAKRLPLAPLQRLVPWAVLGFVINLVTGLVFIAANPRQYIGPPLSL